MIAAIFVHAPEIAYIGEEMRGAGRSGQFAGAGRYEASADVAENAGATACRKATSTGEGQSYFKRAKMRQLS